ncbi:hypothetical protein STCU_06377 [Strigomonas culicis]|uniref:Calcineurin-like phosphoesterase domain-containing protein n=1 Tax=Strigomonas culicis TaxID=28005 RepID=S9UAK7_9TRYP|nr:hypothetical protein STCU_06377 [Strigomonas culicis]|eukprot:EPY25988.1 hypothetical protein STCU_06377 [Strigomonas culicis]
MVVRRSLSRLRICYITDIEGDVAYLQRFLQHADCPLRWEPRPRPLASSPALQYTAVRSHAPPLPAASSSSAAAVAACDAHALQYYTLGLKDDDTHFVFGGDVFDQGADLMLGQCLLDLKARYPDRVHLILGNRDINKMVMTRIVDEVDALTPVEAEDHLFGLHHYPSPQGPPSTFLADIAAAKATSTRFRSVGYAAFLAALRPETPPPPRADRVSFLRWALQHRMGGYRAFEHRRSELRQLRAADAPAPTDAEVASTFFEAARPGGVYAEYLRRGRLACVLEGILFVHGGVTAANVGFVPDVAAPLWEQPQRGRHIAEVHAWVDALEGFRRAAVDAWRRGEGTRGEALRHYALPRLFAPYSVVVGSFVEADGPRLAPLPVVHYLLSGGVSTVCSGHQPCGDAPLVVRQPGGFLMVDADNSYCGRGNALCGPTNHRGGALSFLCMEGDGAVWARGARADGRPLRTS